MVACSSAIGGALTLNYALDCYKDLSGEVMISVILVRVSPSFRIKLTGQNTLSFAIVSHTHFGWN